MTGVGIVGWNVLNTVKFVPTYLHHLEQLGGMGGARLAFGGQHFTAVSVRGLPL